MNPYILYRENTEADIIAMINITATIITTHTINTAPKILLMVPFTMLLNNYSIKLA